MARRCTARSVASGREHVDRQPTGLKDPRDLGERRARIEYVLHDRRRVHEVEVALAEWEHVVRWLDTTKELEVRGAGLVRRERLVDAPRVVTGLPELGHMTPGACARVEDAHSCP